MEASLKYKNQKAMYEKFLIEEAYNQRMMDIYIKESIGWASGEMDDNMLRSLSEATKDTIKSKFSTLWQKVQEIIRKVIGTISNFASSNQGFLEKNKEVIIGRKVQFTEDVEMFPYTEGIKRIAATKIAEFNYDRVKKIDSEEFTNTVLHGYFQINQLECTMEDLQEKLIDYFRGGQEQTIKSTQLNMTDLYNYCIDYKSKIVDVINHDKDVINTSYNKMIEIISKVTIKDNNQEQQAQNASYLFDTELHYSQFFGEYMSLLEYEDNNNTNNHNTNQNNNTGTGGQEKTTDMTQNKPVTKASAQMSNNKMDKSQTKYADSNKLSNGSYEDLDKLDDKCRCWFTTATHILEAKSKVCEEIYKKYFELISKHVKSYLGQAKDDNTGKISQKNGTDFNNDLTPEAKQAKEKQGNITNVSIKYLQGNENCDNPDNYIIKIEREGENGTEVLYQKVADKYKAKPEEGSTYNAGSIKVYRDGKTGIWKIGRTYTNKQGVVSKVKFMYIDPNGAVQNADDYNTANDIKRPQK